MLAILQEFITLLTRPPGNLIYYLVLSFCVAAALPAAVNHWRSNGSVVGKRTVIGLFPILLALLTFFLIGGLAWQGLLPEQLLLPPIDRGNALLSLLLIIWLWTFPEPHRLADAASLLMILLTLTLSVLNLAWWFSQGGHLPYNATLLDRIIQVYAMLLILAGSVLLLVRRPNGWSIGLPMFILLFLGHLVQLIFPDTTGNYAGPVRLAQMAAFPILIALPQRFPSSGDTRRENVLSVSPETQRSTFDPRLIQSLFTLASETELTQVCQELTRTVSIAMLADYCLLISPPDEEWQMNILCWYDLIREEFHTGANLDGREAPVIAAALRHIRPLRLPESKTTPDLLKLAQAINLERTGHLLAVPICDPDGNLICGLFLLSPYTDHAWSSEDQSQLSSLTKPLAQLLQQRNTLAKLNAEREQMQSVIQNGQAKIDQIQQEKEALLYELESFRHAAEVNRAGPTEIETRIAVPDRVQEAIVSLQSGDHLLQKDLSRPKDSEQRESPLPGTDTLEGELHLALEEISRLRAAQTSVTDTITTPTPGILTKLDPQGNQLKTFAHELRQPMSSIVGYTDYLLGESVGILGNLQRKFLERINFSAERMSTILDDMFHATSLESNTLKLNPERVNLYDIINQALQKSSDSMHQKDIDLRVDIPEILPALITDPAALEQVIITLLKNACEVSPQQGQISIRMDIYGEGINQGFGLLQVTNQGGGIATEDISRVFSRQHQNTIPGVGDSGTNLSKIKTLVEALEGRIWVDSLPGIGAIFSVLLPVLPAGSTPDGGNSQ